VLGWCGGGNEAPPMPVGNKRQHTRHASPRSRALRSVA
jgi:hypothetical protein